MATCGEYKTMIQLYVDNELTGSDLEELLSHLEECANCRQEVEELRALSAQIKQARPQVAAPASLRERILKQAAEQAAQQEEQKKKIPGTDQALPFPGRTEANKPRSQKPWLAAAIAAMLCLVAGASLLVPHMRRDANARNFVDTAVMAHRGLVEASMPLEIRSDSPKVVSAWFADKVPFSFRMPDAGIASEDTAKYKLTGGRLLTFGGEPAALLSFRMENDPVCILIASGRKAEARGGKVTYSNGIQFHSMDRDNLHIVTWENKALVYALIFSNPAANKRSCSSCHETAAAPSTAMMDDPHWRVQ